MRGWPPPGVERLALTLVTRRHTHILRYAPDVHPRAGVSPAPYTVSAAALPTAAAQTHTVAVRAGAGTVFATGYNAYGQLGTGTTTNSPVFVAAAAPVLATRSAAAPLTGVYPNPARVQCQLPALPAGTTLRLTDLRGRVVRQQAAVPTLSLTGLAPGLYLLTALAPGQAPRVARIEVE